MAPDTVEEIKELEASRDIMIMYTSNIAQHSRVSLFQRSSLCKHKLSHSGETSHKCDQCEMAFIKSLQ